MEFLNSLLDYDKQLLLFLHAQGYSFWDGFWLFITYPPHWIPLFFLLFYLGYKAFGLNKAIYIAILTAFSALTALTIVNLIKNYFSKLLEGDITKKEKEVNDLYATYITEAEGTAGTKKLGKGPVYKEKRQKHDMMLHQLDSIKAANAIKIKEKEEKAKASVQGT